MLYEVITKKKHTENISSKNNLTELSDEVQSDSLAFNENYNNVEILQHFENSYNFV